MAKVAAEDLELEQLDFISAYINGRDLKEVIYIELPTGHIDLTGNTIDYVVRLNAALYGLK